MNTINRRHFLKSSVLTAGVVAALPPRAWAQASGSNEAVRLALIGLGGKGSDHLETFQKLPGVRIVALCDPDSETLGKAIRNLEKLGGKADGYADARKVYDRPDVDAVVIATPNHTHTLLAFWAVQAGKDVYVEKPVSHNIWEGRKLVEATHKYRRIVQAGTQSRSDPALQEAFSLLQKGELGRMQLIRGFCYKRRKSIGLVDQPQPIPASVDYNLWCGPAPMEPLRRAHLHYDWHWAWATGSGDIGNQGIHEMDMCRWVSGQKAAAPGVISFGGRLGYLDDGRTPNTQSAYFDYRPAPILFEVRGLPMSKGIEGEAMDSFKSIRIGLVVECEHGYFAGGGGGGWFFDKEGKRLRQFVGPGGRDHPANFLKAVRSRKSSDVTAPVEECHASCTLFQMANISYRLGNPRSGAQVLERVKGTPALADSMERMKAHLAANEVSVDLAALQLGPWLTFKPNQERFSGPEAEFANALVKPEYREPFVIPDKV